MHRHVITEAGSVRSEILVGRQVDDAVAEAVTSLDPMRVAVLCQPTTRALADRYGIALEALGISVSGVTLPDGETAKQLGVVEDVYRRLNAEAFTRGDVVLGVGGGALTDVAGFVAATYLRGVPAVYVPTTLLGAVDAAVGGKTAVNVDGKNLAGVFAHPQSVIVDVDVLDALPPAQKVHGAAEAVKTGFIADMSITEAFEADGIDTDLEDVVNKSIAVKAAVVSDDFTEHGRRAILNYGHTVGHGIESTLHIPHGAAVAIGMVAAGTASSHVLGFSGTDRQIDVLRRLGLPTEAPGAKRAQVMAMMALDKKRDASGLRMVLLEAFTVPVVKRVDDATVDAALTGIGLA